MTSASLVSVAPKLSKLIRLLASDKDGEVLGTVAAIRRTLERAGLDLHDLAKILGRADASPLMGEPICWRDIPHSERAAWLARMSTSHLLTSWERDFAASILAQAKFRSWSRLSPKQADILDRCMSKIAETRRKGAAA
jgi:hypothetical protein